MARRRFQDPKPRKEGNWWYLRLWEDSVKDGLQTRNLKRIKLAPAEMKERQVRKIAQDIIVPKNRAIITTGAALNFSEYVDSAYLNTSFTKLASTTRACYQGMIDAHLKPAFGRATLSEITPYTVDAYFSAMPSRGISRPLAGKIRDAFSSIMRSAVRHKHIPTNPLTGLTLPDDPRGKIAKPFIYPAQFDALVQIIPEPYATMVYVAAMTGLRVSEISALKWRNIGPDCITVEQRYFRGDTSHTKTKDSAATISADLSVIERINRLKDISVDVRAGRAVRRFRVVKSSGDDDLVFQSVKDGRPIRDGNALRRFIKPAAAKLGLKSVTWRCLRTSCATWMVRAGADPKSVQGQMRHSRISTTLEIYAQFVPDGQRKATLQMKQYMETQIAEAGMNSGTVAVQKSPTDSTMEPIESKSKWLN